VRGVPSIAILPFDNLTPGGGADWLAAAGPALIDYQLFAQKGLAAFTAGNVNDATGAHASSYLFTRFRVSAGTLVLDAEVEEAAGDRITKRWSIRETASPEGALAAVNALGRTIASGAVPIDPKLAPALGPYGGALAEPDPKARAALFDQAVQLAPEFIPAWLSRIELGIQSHDAGTAGEIAEAMHFAGRIDQARLRYLSAMLSGDPATRIAALSDLTRLAPMHASVWQTLAELETRARNFPNAAVAWTTLAKLQPWNDSALNQLGYCRAWAHDANSAESALAEYQRLDPGDPNPLDSLGEVQFFFTRYADAEGSFLKAHQKGPAFLSGMDLLKAAEARLMTGDSASADRLFQQFLAWRRNAMRDPLQPLWRAQWDFLSGRRRQAMAELAAVLPEFSGEVRSRAEAQYAFWLFATGDLAGARAHADEALHDAQNPGSREAAAMCRFLAFPSAPPAEWTTRANTLLGGAPPQFREMALGYALVLDRHPAEAVPVLARVFASTAPGEDAEQRAMLISALLAAGRGEPAKRLLWPMPIPISSDEAVFSALVFPRWLAWTGKDARFRVLSGDLHLVFE
jgi:tetratricopeptide (TPR) repeat protein